MLKDKIRMWKQEINKLTPKKINTVSVGNREFCKFGRITIPNSHTPGYGIVVPVNGNRNNMYGV